MSLLSPPRAPKKRRPLASCVVIENIERKHADASIITVRFNHPLAQWVERVHVLRVFDHENHRQIVVLSDADHPHDRVKVGVTAWTVEPIEYAVDAIMSGRW